MKISFLYEFNNFIYGSNVMCQKKLLIEGEKRISDIPKQT
jgi:hypothetical protein